MTNAAGGVVVAELIFEGPEGTTACGAKKVEGANGDQFGKIMPMARTFWGVAASTG